MTVRILHGATSGQPVSFELHRQLHGAVPTMDFQRLVSVTNAARLLGRGGAAFPVDRKLQAIDRTGKVHVLINGSEAEPASWKDRMIMRLTPHLVIDGAMVVANALNADRVVFVITDPKSLRGVTRALAERQNSWIEVVAGAGAFAAAEIRSVVRQVNKKTAVPPGRDLLPSASGIDGEPTFGSNVETFAQIGLLGHLGPREFAAVGDRLEPGTSLVSLWGDVPRTGVLETSTDTPLEDLVGPGPGPVLIGGYHGTWLPDVRGLTLARPTLAATGHPLGAGVLARLPEDTCALGEISNVVRLMAANSAQQCGPCAFGLPQIADAVTALRYGSDDAQLARHLTMVRGSCSHPTSVARFVSSALQHFHDEIQAHKAGGCGRAVRGVLPLGVS